MELHFGKVAGGDSDGLTFLDLIPGGYLVGDLRDGILAGGQALHTNFAIFIGFELFGVVLAGDEEGDPLHEVVLGGFLDHQPAQAADGDGLAFVVYIRVDEYLHVLLVQGFKDHDGLPGQCGGVEGEGNLYRAGGIFRSELNFSGNFLAINQQFL